MGDNLLYQEIAEVSWEEVAEAISAEQELLAVASLATGDEDFDQRADAAVRDRYTGERYTYDGTEIDEGPLTRFQDLDLGVMSAVAALVASGCLTTTSCRGHHSNRGERRPLVRFICDDKRLPLISAAAAEAGCGLHLDTWGMLQLYASEVNAFVRFASRLLARRETFASFSMENLFESRDVYGEYLEDWEADHDLEYFSRRELLLMRQRIASLNPIEGQDRLF
ncbi:hypothetical protein ACQP2P_01695 [Dactylosporangium sp. CA-139114]|uniref:hypothetical protein n=1 Tax=Dactylosporangium sp. CA-139114 TaxID=3239931 RepID=UPI003D95289A